MMRTIIKNLSAKLSLVGVVLGLWCGAAVAHSAEVIFKKSVQVDPGVIYLPQVATIKGEAQLVRQLEKLIVGKVDYPGRNTRLSVNAIYNFYVKPVDPNIAVVGNGSIEVKTNARYLSNAEIVSQLLEQITPRMSGKKGHDWDLDAQKLPRQIVLPLEPAQIIVELPGRFSGQGQETAVLQVWQGQKLLSRHNLSFVIQTWGPVVKAKKPIQRSQMVNRSDITVERVELTYNRRKIVQNPADVVGRTALRTIGRDALIFENWLEKPYLVKSGDPLQLNVAVGNGVVSIAALAKQNGYEGQIIEVLNENSRSVVRAKITKAGEAWVVN